MIDMTPIWLTLKLASVTVVLLMITCIPLAWWLSSGKGKFKIFVESLTALPLVLPPTVLGFYLLVFLAPSGLLGSFWQNLTGNSLTFSFTGLVIASCLYSLPFVVQPLQTAFEMIDRRQVEAAWMLGASHQKTFIQVVLPQARRGLVTAIVLGFAHTVGEFGVVLMVGGNIPGETQVISIAIYEKVETIDYAAAHTYSMLLLIFSFVTLVGVYSFNRRLHYGVRL